MKRKSRVGERVNMLICTGERKEGDHWILTCLCDCGRTREVNQNWFRQLKSCGCIKAYSGSSNHKTHGMSQSKEYLAWNAMRERCLNENHKAYGNYGGRGVTVCSRWQKSFENFLSDMGNAPTRSHTLERVEVNQGYSPENCKWATRKEQANNRRNNIIVEMFGETATVAQWCDYYKVSPQFVGHRVGKMGMSYEEAFLTPKHHKRKG